MEKSDRESKKDSGKKPLFKLKSGRTYFTGQTERNFYFVLALVLLLIGLLFKLGIL